MKISHSMNTHYSYPTSPFIQALVILFACFILLSCEKAPNSLVNWDKNIALSKATDINKDSKIVEINLEAIETDIELRPGVFTKMWTYNGIFPGPTIEANIGDTLIVNFTNKLNTPTTVHWHGLELPANMDGSMLAQPEILSNGTFRYEFKLLNAATYWYHPHVNSNVQVEMGLYGALIVREPEIDKQHNFPNKETTIIFDDILLDDNGQISPPSYQTPITDPISNAITQLNGREGDVFLVNGKTLEPLTSIGDDIKAIKVHSGTPVRLRLINAANARFFRLSIPNHTIYQIGGDGGLLPSPRAKSPIPLLDTSFKNISSRTITSITPKDGEPLSLVSDPDLNKGIMIVPGERSDIVFTPNGNAGDLAYLEWHFFPRGFHGVEDDGNGNLVINHNHQSALTLPFRILKFEFDESSKINQETYIPPSNLRSIPLIQTTFDTETLPIIFGHGLPDPTTGNINFFAAKDSNGNGVPFSMMNNAIDSVSLIANTNQTYIWEVTNLTQGDHPFHPHGFTFQHISTQYIDNITPENNRTEFPLPIDTSELKDTIRIPARPGAKGTSRTIVKLAVNFSDIGRVGSIQASGKIPSQGFSGGWFVHCHILEHSNRGMGTYLNLF